MCSTLCSAMLSFPSHSLRKASAAMWQFFFPFLLCLCIAQRVIVQADSEDHDAFSYFVTRPDIEAPKWNIQTYDADALQQGFYWFIAPYLKLEQNLYPMWNGPHIYRSDGQLVWSGGAAFDYVNVHDFRVSELPDQRVLSLIRGAAKDGGIPASGSLWDASYSPYQTLDLTANDFKYTNMHDFNIINGGKTALALLHERPILVPVPGTNVTCHTVMDGFMEFDMETNEILFQWSAKGRVPLNESDVYGMGSGSLADHCRRDAHSRGHKTREALHVNSIDKFPDGDYLLSARNTDALYKISHKDGSIVWRLGGINSDFALDEYSRFERQHHARVISQNSTHTLISLFNNAKPVGFLSGHAKTDRSAGLIFVLRTDIKPMTASIQTRFDKPYWHTDFELSNKTGTRGSMQMLPNGNAFLGWVSHCHISEHAPDGRLLQQAAILKGEVATYRSYKFAWEGRPTTAPDVVVKIDRKKQGIVTSNIYVSWNGATEVASWKVLQVGGLFDQILAEQDSAGFETALALDGAVDDIVVAGFDKAGQELGRSLVTGPSGAKGSQPKSASRSLAPWLWMGVGVVIGVVIFLAFVFRKRFYELFSKAKSVAYRPVHGVDPEADELLYDGAREEEEDEQRSFNEKEAVELEEYKDSRSSGEVSDKPR